MNGQTLEHRIGTFITDRNLIVIFWDERLGHITGIPPENAIRKPLDSIIPNFKERNLPGIFREVIEEGLVRILTPAFHKYLIPCKPLQTSKNYEFMQQRVTIAPVRAGEQIVNTVVTIEDVTQRLDYEKELVEQLQSPDEKTRLRAAEIIGHEDTESATELLRSIGDESWRVRHVAVDTLSRIGDADVVAKLIHVLKKQHTDLSVLNSILSVLALTDMDTLTPLIWLLNDPDDDLRIYSAQVLGDRYDSAAIPALINALKDDNQNVCYHAIESLGKLRAKDAVEPLLNIVESQDFFLSFPAIDALVRIDDKSAAGRLLPFLENPALCPPIVEALGKLGDEEVAQPLVALLNKPGAPVHAIAIAIASLFQRYETMYKEGSHIIDIVKASISLVGAHNLIDGLDSANSEELKALALVLGWLEGKAVEQALTRLLGNPSARKEVVDALVRYGFRVTQLLVEQLKNEDIETCRAAIVAIGRIGDSRAVSALIDILDRDDELTVVAIGALAKIGDRRSFHALLELMGHSNVAIRQAVVGALNSIGHPEMPEYIKDYLVNPNPLVRESAVKIAGYFGYPDCVDLLLSLAKDEDENVRAAVIEHIPYLESEKGLSALIEAIKNDTAKVRAACARAFSHMEGHEALKYLITALEDEDPWVRYFACRSLGRIGIHDALNALTKIAEEDKARYVRFAAIEAIGNIGGARAVSVLSVFSNSFDQDIARSAISALGKVGHPDALNPLFSALKSSNPELQRDAARALGEHGGEGVARALQWVAATEQNPALVKASIDAIKRLKTREAAEVLIELAVDQTRRHLCIEALYEFGEKCIEWIADGLSYPHAGVRVAIIEALARMKRPLASERILSALDDKDGQVRLAAVEAIGYLGNRNADKKLSVMAKSDEDISVRRAARIALKR